MSTGFGGAESGGIRIGDTVAVFAQGPIGLCATVGARLRGASRIVTTLCPGGKERMGRLLRVLESGRVDLRPLVTHRFTLDEIEDAYDLFSHQRDGVLKVAIAV
jgi:threonine dehydrogenase-like Zn-dependent dehydrogenase